MGQKNRVRDRRARPTSSKRAIHGGLETWQDLWQQLLRAEDRAKRSAVARRLRIQLAECDAQYHTCHDKLSFCVLAAIVDFVEEEVWTTPVARRDHIM
jgi:hypothetical protein